MKIPFRLSLLSGIPILVLSCLLESKPKGTYLLNLVASKNLLVVDLGNSLMDPVISVSELFSLGLRWN